MASGGTQLCCYYCIMDYRSWYFFCRFNINNNISTWSRDPLNMQIHKSGKTSKKVWKVKTHISSFNYKTSYKSSQSINGLDNFWKHAELPTKDETSDTVVRNLFIFSPFSWFRASYRPKLACFYAYSFCKPSKYSIESRNQKANFKLSYFGSSLQSHPLWVTLYMGIRILNDYVYYYNIVLVNLKHVDDKSNFCKLKILWHLNVLV